MFQHVSYTPRDYANSLRSVVLYNLAETFDLVDEELIWTRHELDKIAGALERYLPANPTLSTLNELRGKTYTNLLSIRTRTHTPRGNVSHSAKNTPSLNDWIDALAQPIEGAYPDLTGSESLFVRQTLGHILRNIGVGDPESPRGCTRLPVELKMLLADKKWETLETTNQ